MLTRKPWLELPDAERTLLLDKIQAMVKTIESGRADEITQLLDELIGIRESHLFQELGRLTRQLHEVLTSPERDATIARLADTELPAAKERLNYVIAKSEEATHQTLAAVEETIPIVHGLGTRAQEQRDFYLRLSQGEPQVTEFRACLGELFSYFDSVREQTTTISHNLTKVLVAQEAQDLTGQVIRRVIELVKELETQLVGVMASCGDLAPRGPKPTTTPEGPQLNTASKQAVVSSQDEVDELLSSLGF